MFALIYSRQKMAGSRSFLVVLLLATVTCIVLIQISMDGWFHPGNFKLYNFAIINNQKETKIDKDASADEIAFTTGKTSFKSTSILSTTSKQITPQKKWTSVASKSISPSYEKKSSTAKPPKKILIKANDPDISAKGQIQLLTYGHSANRYQDRIQEIMKRKNTFLQRRVRGDPLKSVQAMPVIDPSKVNRIFLITYFRSGSSFIGELLQQNWKTFYQFEPLHYMTYGSRISSADKTEEAFNLFSSIYRCNFTDLDDYFKWIRRPSNQFLFTRSLFLWFTCRMNPRMCFVPDYVSTVCSRAPVQIIKTTRLHMWQLKQFLDKNQDLNIKVVYLIRDPRGIISSRWSLSDWCNATDCSNPDIICSEMRNDIHIFNELQNNYPSKFIQIRYEDMATNPEIEAKKLFQFLDLPITQSIKIYLRTHTKAKKSDNLNPYSTKRNSSTMAYSWKKRVNFEQVQTVQSFCSDVIKRLNYSVIYKASELSKDMENEPSKYIKEQLTHTEKNKITLQRTPDSLKMIPNKTPIISPFLNKTYSNHKENEVITKISVSKSISIDKH